MSRRAWQYLASSGVAGMWLASLSCAGESPRAAIRWTPSATVAPTGGAAPVLAVAPSGRITLAWVSAPNGGTDGRLFLRPNVGPDSAQSPVSELRDPLGSLSIYGEVPPKIAYAPDGTLYAAYLVTKVVPGMRWPQNALRFARSRDGGAHWEAPSTVTRDAVFGSYDDHALLVGADGAIYLSWLAEVKHDSSYTLFARSTDGGRTWSTPQIVDDDRSCPCCRTALAAGPDGTLYVAWRKRFPGDERDIVVARSRDHGTTWSTPVRVHVDAWAVSYCPDAGPSVKVGRDGVVHVAWWTGRQGRAGTQYAQSRDGGATFSAPVALGLAEYSRSAHIQLGLGEGLGADSGLVVAAWDDGTRQVPQIVVRVSRDGGRHFAAAEVLSAPESEAGYPVVSIKSGVVLVAWQERPLAAASADSARRATLDKNDPQTYVNAIGAMRVMLRSGLVLEGEQ